MNFRLITILMLMTASTLANEKGKNIVDPGENKRENEDVSRGKRGFVITPLTVLPTALIAQLQPYLRALLPPAVLNEVATLLPTAPQARATALPLAPILSATAPLGLNRALIQANAPAQPSSIPSSLPSPILLTNVTVQQQFFTPYANKARLVLIGDGLLPLFQPSSFIPQPSLASGLEGTTPYYTNNLISLPLVSSLPDSTARTEASRPPSASNAPTNLPPSPPVVPSPKDFAAARLAAATAVANSVVSGGSVHLGRSFVAADGFTVPFQRTSLPVLVSTPTANNVISSGVLPNTLFAVGTETQKVRALPSVPQLSAVGQTDPPPSVQRYIVLTQRLQNKL